MAAALISFIISGGIGSRLWPLSREDYPKQFHNFSGLGSMLTRTLQRLRAREVAKDPIYLIASESHAARIQNEIDTTALNGGRIIFEPIGRNTAAAVALATEITLREHGDQLILIAPSDHEIETAQQFWHTIAVGIKAANAGNIVAFGIRPDKPETGYGYIEIGDDLGGYFRTLKFVEKPDHNTAQTYLNSGRFFWNSGLYLFSAQTMKTAFLTYAPDIWHETVEVLYNAHSDIAGTWPCFEGYKRIRAESVDYAIMEHVDNSVVVPSQFRWNDLGSWQSLLDLHANKDMVDDQHNVIIGDVVAINCQNSYLRSDNSLLSAVGLKDMAVVVTADATFVAPVSQSQNVRQVVAALERSGRLETKFTPAPDRLPISGAYRNRVEHWLFHEALPLWSNNGVDDKGGFYEALDFAAQPLNKPRRMRTMARQIYAFAIAGAMGWNGPTEALIEHGLQFICKNGRGSNGGWVRSLNGSGGVIDPTEDCYDQSCVLLALAHAHRAGIKRALPLAVETFAFIDEFLNDKAGKGFKETSNHDTQSLRRSNPHMHLLECFLAWFDVTGDKTYLQRAKRIVDLFQSYFFNSESWTLGEYFDHNWQVAKGELGDVCEPGHHFEWASLLVEFANAANVEKPIALARKLYASTIANGLNRATGLAYNTISRQGMPIDHCSRSWPQTEAVKAALALDGVQGPDLKPEIEARVGRLFRWHIEAAPKGLWIDLIDEQGKARATEVPASIFYHLVSALTRYMEKTNIL